MTTKEDKGSATVESQLKSLLERSSGTVKKLDGQISKLDEHLCRTSGTKHKKARDAGPSLAAQADAHPFNKWLVCIAGSDSTRATESDPLNRPLTFEDISLASPQRCSGSRREFRAPGNRRDLASSPCHRGQALSFHGPSAFHSLSPWANPRVRSPLQGSGEQIPAINTEQASRTAPKTSRLTAPRTGKNVETDIEVDHVQRLEERMESKLHALQAMLHELSVHSASKRDVEVLQVQVARLQEDQEAMRADVAMALKECRAARAAFTSEHWSARRILEQVEQLKQGQEFTAREHGISDPIMPDNMRSSGSDDEEKLNALQQSLKMEGDHKCEGNALERITRLELVFAMLQREKSSPTRLQMQAEMPTAEASPLRGLVEEIFEKCDTLQKCTARDAARFQDDYARREKSIAARCDQLERGLQGIERSMALRHAEVDENSGRMSRDMNKAYSKMEELESQIMAYKANAMDMHSHMLNAQQDLSEKWRTSHMQLSGQVHATTEWCDSFRNDLTNKLQIAGEKSAKMEAGVQQLGAALSSVVSRVEGNENEIENLDENILHICSTIHSLQSSMSKQQHQCSPDAEVMSVSDRQSRPHRATRKQGCSTDHSERSTNTAHTTRENSCGDISSHAMQDSGGNDRGTRHLTLGRHLEDCRGMVDLSPFSSPILSATGQELFSEDKGVGLKSTDAVQRIARETHVQMQRQESGSYSSSSAGYGRQQRGHLSRGRRSQSGSPIASSTPAQVHLEGSQGPLMQAMSPLSRDLHSPTQLRVDYSRRNGSKDKGSCGKEQGSDPLSPSQQPFKASAPVADASVPSTPQPVADGAGPCSSRQPPPEAIVTSTRPASSHIIVPPTPELIKFD